MNRLVSVIIPVRNQAHTIADTVTGVRLQRAPGVEIELLVVDDGSTDGSAAAAESASAAVLRLPPCPTGGNPAAARNNAAKQVHGDFVVFLDADCVPAEKWLEILMRAHDAGEAIVGGALDLPPGLSLSARCDYYCGWYHVHSRRRPGPVPNHPPGNLSVDRNLFLSTKGFEERHPIAFAHEELGWQAELTSRRIRIWFEPSAVVYHHNRSGFGNLLRRNYRWAYSAVEAKAGTGAARCGWMYRYPRTLAVLAPMVALAHATYIIGCWARAGFFEPVALLPAVLAARLAYAAGTTAGTLRWIRMRRQPAQPVRPQWE